MTAQKLKLRVRQLLPGQEVRDSSLASVLTVTELLLNTRGLVAATFQPVALYGATGLIYFLLSNTASRIFAALEHRLNRPYRSAT